MIDTASDALVITPSVPLASDFTRFVKYSGEIVFNEINALGQTVHGAGSS